MKYRSKPVVIEAIQFTGTNGREVRAWVNEKAGFPSDPDVAYFITKSMSTSTGNQAWNYVREGHDWNSDVIAAVYDPAIHRTWLPVQRGQWIIFGTRKEFYPCQDDVFREKYEAASS